MGREMAESVIRNLQVIFKREFPADGIIAIFKELASLPDKALELAGDDISLNRSYLPSPAQLLEAAKKQAKVLAAEQSRQREREWAQVKGGETPDQIRRAGSIFSREQSDKHAQHSVQALMLMFSDVSREEKLECFKAMETSYPGAGWGKAGSDLQRFWEEGRMWTS